MNSCSSLNDDDPASDDLLYNHVSTCIGSTSKGEITWVDWQEK